MCWMGVLAALAALAAGVSAAAAGLVTVLAPAAARRMAEQTRRVTISLFLSILPSVSSQFRSVTLAVHLARKGVKSPVVMRYTPWFRPRSRPGRERDTGTGHRGWACSRAPAWIRSPGSGHQG